MLFHYGTKEIEYLKKRDPRLGEAMDFIGKAERKVDSDLFSSVVHHIIGQQISMKAQETVWSKIKEALGTVNADTVAAAGEEELRACGISFRKVSYIKDFAARVQSGAFDLEAVRKASDEEAVRLLASLKGIGTWTAEMILLFCLERPDILSYDDLAIKRGITKLYGLETVDRATFEELRKRYSPYGSIASLYLWDISSSSFPLDALSDPSRIYTSPYSSPIGNIVLTADALGLTGVSFENQGTAANRSENLTESEAHPVLKQAETWLNDYFAGQRPKDSVPLHLKGTDFQREVWDILRTIPYGETVTYGEIAKQLADRKGLARMSAQAVGGAVGRNPISILVPCHRVLGANRALTGYAGGVAKKKFLLDLEGIPYIDKISKTSFY